MQQGQQVPQQQHIAVVVLFHCRAAARGGGTATGGVRLASERGAVVGRLRGMRVRHAGLSAACQRVR